MRPPPKKDKKENNEYYLVALRGNYEAPVYVSRTSIPSTQGSQTFIGHFDNLSIFRWTKNLPNYTKADFDLLFFLFQPLSSTKIDRRARKYPLK